MQLVERGLSNMSLGKTFLNGIFSANPIFRLAIGLVPALGITHLAINGVYMSINYNCSIGCSTGENSC